MEIIDKFAQKHQLKPHQVRQEMEKALRKTPLSGLCDAEFFLETVVYMIAHHLKQNSYR